MALLIKLNDRRIGVDITSTGSSFAWIIHRPDGSPPETFYNADNAAKEIFRIAYGQYPAKEFSSVVDSIKRQLLTGVTGHELCDRLEEALLRHEVPNLSPGRIPYTYHHDFIRRDGPALWSRSDVATWMHGLDHDPELKDAHSMIGCLCQLLSYQPLAILRVLIAENLLGTVRDAMKILDRAPETYRNFEIGDKKKE